MYQCPKCKSKNTYKDRRLGGDTGDRKCKDCGYEAHAKEFKVKDS